MTLSARSQVFQFFRGVRFGNAHSEASVCMRARDRAEVSVSRAGFLRYTPALNARMLGITTSLMPSQIGINTQVRLTVSIVGTCDTVTGIQCTQSVDWTLDLSRGSPWGGSLIDRHSWARQGQRDGGPQHKQGHGHARLHRLIPCRGAFQPASLSQSGCTSLRLCPRVGAPACVSVPEWVHQPASLSQSGCTSLRPCPRVGAPGRPLRACFALSLIYIYIFIDIRGCFILMFVLCMALGAYLVS